MAACTDALCAYWYLLHFFRITLLFNLTDCVSVHMVVAIDLFGNNLYICCCFISENCHLFRERPKNIKNMNNRLGLGEYGARQGSASEKKKSQPVEIRVHGILNCVHALLTSKERLNA